MPNDEKKSSKPRTQRKASASRSMPKTRTSKTKKETLSSAYKRPSLILKVLALAVVILFFGFGIKFAIDQTFYANPLLGKWRAQTTLGIIEIEFERDTFSSFGSKNPISYEISKGSVVVMDERIKVGSTYKIIDENTIASEAGGFKTIYKRVK